MDSRSCSLVFQMGRLRLKDEPRQGQKAAMICDFPTSPWIGGGSAEPSPAARRLAGILAGAGMCQVASCTGASLRRAPPGGSPTWTSSEHGFQALREGARAVSLMAWALCLLLAKQDTGQLKARGIHTLLGTGVAWVHRVGRIYWQPHWAGSPI